MEADLVDLSIGLLALVATLALVGASSALVAALQRLNRARVRFMAAEGIARAGAILDTSDRSGELESTAAAANSVALVLGSGLIAYYVFGRPGGDGPLAYGIGLSGLLLLLWVELGLRAVGARRPEDTVYWLQTPLWVLHRMFRPLSAALSLPARRALLGKDDLATVAGQVTDEDLRMIVDAVEEEGTLEEEEREMIHSIFEFGDRTAREIMVPRVDVVAVEASQPLRNVLERIKTRAHSRIPIYEGNIDNIVGVVYAKDLLRYMDTGDLDQPARSLARAPHFTPESKKLDALLHEMQKNKVHMAIVVDEYGGTDGLVTIEDLIEEIVGEIHDEYDVEERWIEVLEEGEAICNARVSIHDLNDTLGINLTNGEYDTVGGLVYHHLGKIPVVGDSVQMGTVCLTVLSTAGKRIKKVKIEVAAQPCGPENRIGSES